MRQRRERSRYRWLVSKFLLRATKTQFQWALLRMYMKSGSELSHSRTRKLKYLSTNFHLWFWGASQVINSLNSFGVLMRFREHNRATSRIRKALLHCLTVIETKVITVNLFFFFLQCCGACGLSMWLSGKESACQCRKHKRHGFDPWVRKISWGRKWQATPVFLPGKFHGQRSLVGSQRVGHDWVNEYAPTLGHVGLSFQTNDWTWAVCLESTDF